MGLLPYPKHFMPIADKLSVCLLHSSPPIKILLLVGLLLVAAGVYLTMCRRPTVYLIDYACSVGIANCRVPVAVFLEYINLDPFFDSQSISFMTRMHESSGIGDEASDFYIPPHGSFQEARTEAELVVFGTIDDLLAKTGVPPEAIDVLVVNCSVFAPVPSISDMIVNRYKLSDDVKAVNLSGMGCSAGVISVGLAAGMLQARGAARYALVVSTEIITSNFYNGNERAMQLSNVLFRVGGSAALLSTSDQGKARFRLSHLVRTSTAGTHYGSHSCVVQQEDGEGILGIKLSKDLLNVAGEALKANITAVAPLVLPLSEQLRFAMSLAASRLRLLVSVSRGKGAVKEPPVVLVPDFRKAFDHFCVHCGGRAVIDRVQRSLRLADEQVEASRMTLRRFGNTSSSSVWYAMAHIEAKGRMRKRDRVWFGSGFKCNSAVWECIRPAEEPDRAWAGCIHRYPIKS